MLSFATKKDAVVERLRSEILGGKLLPATPIRQDAVASRLGVSPTPVREALVILEAEGFLEHKPHRGFIVTRRGSLDSAEMLQILEVRALLESFVVKRIAAAEAKSAAPRLLKNVATAKLKLRDGFLVELREVNAAFHRELIRGLKSEVLENTLVRLSMHSMFVPNLDKKRLTQVLESHARIANALREGNSARAARLLREHLMENVAAFTRAERAQGESRGRSR